MRLDEGLLFVADTRTNAGVDNVSTFRKLHVLEPAPDRLFVLQSAGNLATTHEVLDRIEADLRTPGEHESLANVGHLFEAALYVGRLSQEVVRRHRDGLAAAGADATATFILGGQIDTQPPDILLVYPEGNYIRASEERPFLQIGESKYGKYMLDLAVSTGVTLDVAVKIGLSSMLSTARANLSVGPPYDVGIYRTGSLHLEHRRIDEGTDYLARLQDVWVSHLRAAIDELPLIPGPDVDDVDPD